MSKATRSNGQRHRPLTVAVISDVHAYEGIEPDKAPSHCCITENDPSKNPLAGLSAFIKQEGLAADVLLCPGDLGDRAQPVAIQHTWRLLTEIRDLIGARDFAATTGNHDIDSRHAHNDYDAKGLLQTLDPPYPLGDDSLNDRYWSRHFATLARDTYRILVINSSAFHGEGRYSETKRPEYEQGRVSSHTLTAIKKALDTNPAPPINIALCHHHPHPHSELRLGENDLMIGGRDLLEVLDSGSYGRWFVLHGHKHHPKLEYAAGSTSSPVVFAAGSLSAVLYRELQTASRNQFYLIEFPHAVYGAMGFVGRFRAWDWLSGHGWKPALRGSQLPSSGGFGWRGDIELLAQRVARRISKRGSRWQQLVQEVPDLEYLLPKDLEQLVRVLREKLSFTVEPPDCVPPTLIGRSQ